MLFLWAVIDGVPLDNERAEDKAADHAAVERMARGDERALAELYDRYARPVYSLALRILQDCGDAEDVVQEVFAQAWGQASRYDVQRGTVAAWLLTRARSRALDRLRARRARPDLAGTSLHAVEIVDSAGAADLQLVSAEQVARVREALAELPVSQRAALELAYYDGLSHAEIATRLDQPLGTIKTRIRLAMIKLRESLGGTI
jgi:RNA polymerase sigma-70 factor, ECF subfamily